MIVYLQIFEELTEKEVEMVAKLTTYTYMHTELSHILYIFKYTHINTYIRIQTRMGT